MSRRIPAYHMRDFGRRIHILSDLLTNMILSLMHSTVSSVHCPLIIYQI